MTRIKDTMAHDAATIREAREARGLTQAEVAKAAGMSRSHYSLVELGTSGLSVAKAQRLGAVLDLTLDDIFGAVE